MEYPRLPDWLVYGAIAGAVLAGALSRRDEANAPPPPPPPPGAEQVPLGPASPFDPVSVIRVREGTSDMRGVAFSISDRGFWLTTREAVRGCARPALKVAEGRAVRAQRIRFDDPSVTLLYTPGGPPGLPLESTAEIKPGVPAYVVGFTAEGPAEISALLVGAADAPRDDRGDARARGLAFGENGRTEGLKAGLDKLQGAPVLSADGRLMGMVAGIEPRRGRIRALGPEPVENALAAVSAAPSLIAVPETLTAETYGRLADQIRLDRQVAQVLCLRR